MVRDARRLIDSPPGDNYGPHFSAAYEEDTDEEPQPGQTGDQPHGNIPPGWSMLPTEADFQARQDVRRSHGEIMRGWYWSDERPLYEQTPGPSAPENRYERGPSESDFAPDDEYYSPHPANGYYGQARWIRILYAVLLLALSLPFLLSIMGQIWTLLNNLR